MKRLNSYLSNLLDSICDIVKEAVLGLIHWVWSLCLRLVKFLVKTILAFAVAGTIGVPIAEYGHRSGSFILQLLGSFIVCLPVIVFIVNRLDWQHDYHSPYAPDAPKSGGTYVNGAGQRVNILGGAPSVQNPPKW